MVLNKSKLVGLLFAFLMVGGLYTYANGIKSEYVSTPDTIALKNLNEKQFEILKKIKECIGIEDIRIIQTKNYKIIGEWAKAEAHDKRTVTTHLNKKTGVYTSMSMPNGNKAHQAIFHKVQNCLDAEDIRIIETKDNALLKSWTREELENKDRIICVRPYCAYPDKETGIKTAISSPKAEGDK